MLFCAFSCVKLATDNIFRSKLNTFSNLSSLSIRQLHICRRNVGIGVNNVYILASNEGVGLTAKLEYFNRRFPLTRLNYVNVLKTNGDVYQHGVAVFSSTALKTSTLDVNTNVIKDIILFRYENPKYYKVLNGFAFFQFFFWIYLSHFAFTTLKDTPIDKNNIDNLPWWRKINLGENKYRNGITVLCFLIGYGILGAAWAFTLKSVRYLVLRKGGESVTFVTYGPFGKNRMTTIPISQVSCEESRQAARVQLPMKVKKHYLYYVLDMRGEFTNPRLFDHSVGVKRVWKT